jgi:hypothetical protein
MNKLSGTNHLSCELMVNGTIFHFVQLRQTEALDGFDVLIADHKCGTFAIHDGFDLSLREGSTSRRVTLEELKNILRNKLEFPIVLEVPNCLEMAELRLFDGWFDDLESPLCQSRSMSRITMYGRCVRRVKAVLAEASIPCVLCGAVFVVPNRAQARRILLRAGFQPSRISAGALIEPFSGSAVYLLERTGALDRGIRRK